MKENSCIQKINESVWLITNVHALKIYNLCTCRALRLGLTTQEQIDDYDPALMFTIPRLAIVAGLVMFPDGPLNLDREPRSLSELFRPFRV